MFILTPVGLVSGILTVIVTLILIVIFSHKAPSILTWRPRSLAALRAGMTVTSIAIVTASLLILLLISYYFKLGLTLWSVSLFLAFILLIQWLISPYIIDFLYRVRDADPYREGWLIDMVREIARKSGIKPPKVKIAEIDIPNAFAYSSPLAGRRVAVTRGLIRLLPREEIKAVIAHEIGHLKHKDVQTILLISFFPVLLYYLGRMLIESSFFYERRRDEGLAAMLLIGFIALVAGILFNFIVMHFNRLREYYADAHSAISLGSGRPLQRALARLDLAYKRRYLRAELSRSQAVAMLFIYAFVDFFYDPIDEYIDELRHRKVSALIEIFSSHPPIPKRIRFLDDLEAKIKGGVKIKVE